MMVAVPMRRVRDSVPVEFSRAATLRTELTRAKFRAHYDWHQFAQTLSDLEHGALDAASTRSCLKENMRESRVTMSGQKKKTERYPRYLYSVAVVVRDGERHHCPSPPMNSRLTLTLPHDGHDLLDGKPDPWPQP